MKHSRQTNRRGLRRYVIDGPNGTTSIHYARSIGEIDPSAGLVSVDREPRTAANMSDSARYYRAEDRAILRRLRAKCGEVAG